MISNTWKRRAPAATATPLPTSEPVVIVQTVEVPIDRPVYVQVEAAPEAPVAAQDGSGAPEAPTVEAQPAGPDPMLPNESLGDYAARQAAEQHTIGAPAVVPACPVGGRPPDVCAPTAQTVR